MDLTHISGSWPYWGVLIAAMVEGEIAYLGAAALVAAGQLNPWAVVGAGTVGFNNSGNANRIDMLALELSAANRAVALSTASSLTIGEVGPYKGITTNSQPPTCITGLLPKRSAAHPHK